MINTITTENPKKRLDLELSLYLAYCLGLFFIVAVLGTTILAQRGYNQTSVITKERSEKFLSNFKDTLPVNIAKSDSNFLVINATKLRNELLQLTTAPSMHYKLLIFASALFTIFVLILFLFISSWVQVRLFGPISRLIDLSSRNDALTQLGLFKTNSTDIEILRNLFTNLVIHRVENEKLEKQAAIANIAAQVAHDIRSPLAALSVLESDMAILSEDKRILIRSAINRIRDISNNLLEKKRYLTTSDKANIQSEHPSAQLIFALLEQMITEKRTQYRSKLDIEINDEFDSQSYGLFALIHPMEFKNIISNLINNAVEAMPNGGRIVLGLSSNNKNIQIVVKDDGNGIDENILPHLTHEGQTYGKKDGSGLGLYHAKKTLESWEGKIDISSAKGKGTKVTITLPKASAPDWFVEKIFLKPGMAIAVVDDDASIHQIWQTRIASFRNEFKIEMLHFSTPTEFQKYLQSNSLNNGNKLYLIDYEFLGHPETGLDLIEKEGIGNCSILVTSRYEEPKLRQRSEQLTVKLIPKGIAGFAPIELDKKILYDAVLLDDDELIRTVWQQIAEKQNKNLLVFEKIHDLYKNLKQIDFNTPIYIDSDLKCETRGQDVAHALQIKGYQNLYLATGYDPSYLGKISSVKAIVGKKPPWLIQTL